ncbi:MAG TPA: GNAT family N-acetyltransferase [Myxococcota bacterium]|nr:GNAT family N-acetyltransferase [Myxococcota bacterium]
MTRKRVSERPGVVDERQIGLDFGPPLPRVREALPSEHRTLLELVARAFAEDPVATWLFPDAAVRAARYGPFAGLAIESFATHARVYTESAHRGVAIWQAPDAPPVGPARQLRLLLRLLGIARGAFGRALRMSDRMSRAHPEAPHWYLAVLGTDPDARRRGIGGTLLAPVLARCDASGLPAYLESSNASNLGFYTRHGFELLDEIRIPDGPSLWRMARAPRR